MEERAKNRVVLTDRKHMVLEGVQHVGSFDENEITLETNMGYLCLKGEGLHITQLNLDVGSLVAEGFFTGIEFKENQSFKGKSRGVLGRFLK